MISKPDPAAGQCSSCHHVRRIESARASVFYLCRRSEGEASFAKYPHLPMRDCPGYEAVEDSST